MKKWASLLLLFVVSVLFIGCTIKPVDEISDSEKFAKEYSVSKDNPFEYVTASEAIELLENGTGIIYFGFPECPWCQSTIKILVEVLKSKNIKNAYYYNIKEIREKNTVEYQKIVELIKDYLFEDENDNKRVFVPDIYFVKDGKILGHNNDLSTMSGNPEEYLDDEKKEDLKNKFLQLVVKLYADVCTEGC